MKCPSPSTSPPPTTSIYVKSLIGRGNWHFHLFLESPRLSETRLHPINLIGRCQDGHMTRRRTSV